MEPFKCPNHSNFGKIHMNALFSLVRWFILGRCFTMIHLFKTFQDWSFFQCARRLEVSWRQISTWRPPQDCSTRSISLCVSAPTSIRGCLKCRGDIPSRSLHFFSHYFFGIEMDNPLFVEHFPWQASACPYVSSPTCHCLWLVRLVH